MPVLRQLRALIDALFVRRLTALRYVLVSVLNLVNHQVVLFLGHSVWGLSGGWANALAATVSAVPAYLLSKRWVWKSEGNYSLRDEIVPFWGIAVLGLVVSSLMAEAADRLFGSGLAVAVGSLIGYVIVWILKFVLLERMFARASHHHQEKVSVG